MITSMNETMLPKHIAIIMDGNGRWAKERYLPRVMGHREGMKTVRTVVTSCVKKKIEVLTLFAFSTENWKRPLQEVNFLMDLFITYLKREIKKLHEQNVQVHIIGNRAHFNDKLRLQMLKAEELTANNTGLKLIIAADYGGRWDISESIRKIAKEIEDGRITSQDISMDLIRQNIAFAQFPDPDLLIRTSGEQRISNFMLWQLANTKLYFTDIYWPDFSVGELDKALVFFATRRDSALDV